MCLCVLEIPVCCLVAAVASEVGSVCGGRDGGRSVRGRREGGVEE